MYIVPMKALKDATTISQLCHETEEPVHITKNGYPDMVIMSSQVYEALARDAQTGRVVALVQEGIDAIERGEYRDAFEAVASIRGKYGL